MTLREMLQAEVEAMEFLGMPAEQSLKGVVLKHGRAYELDREASAKLGNGAVRNCFENAALTALDNEELTYVEGFAHRGTIAVRHAWVINREGRALEVTWRDGGHDCGFCVDGEVDQEYDEDDPETWDPVTCEVCGGTGERDEEWDTLERAQYFGIAVDDKTLVSIVRRRNVWGVLDTEQELDEILAARDA